MTSGRTNDGNGLMTEEGGSVWRPIETAPRDGTLIDLWAVTTNKWGAHDTSGDRCTDAHWGEVRLGEPPRWVWRGGEDPSDIEPVEEDNDVRAVVVTHWMPIPPPPDQGQVLELTLRVTGPDTVRAEVLVPPGEYGGPGSVVVVVRRPGARRPSASPPPG